MPASWLQAAPDSLWNRFKVQGRLRSVSLFHLIWTMWAFGDLIFGQTLPPHWISVTFGSFAIFLLLYWQGYVRPVHRMVWFASGMALLGYLTMPVNQGAGGCYVIFACAYMGFHGLPRRCLLRILVVLVDFVIVARFLLSWPWGVTLMLSFIALAVGVANMLYRLNEQKTIALKLSHDEVRRLAATAERERIGRDLHDLLGHTLSLITLKLELSRRLLDRDVDAARREMEEAERVARHALAEVRSAVTGIRASGLAAELASARLLLGASGVHFDYSGELPALPAPVEAELALVLREAVTNIHRHALASRAEARIDHDEHRVLLCVSDNGRGGLSRHGNGVTGMGERMRHIGGTLQIDSPAGKGTRLTIELPLASARRLDSTPSEHTA
jgi:two-component system, NarL family, sensor histidine kinase DesK